ncbi:GntR family transcriptional regulator [Streptomyces sp. NPDC001820]|uniref:GntR family transcriptional regulator n=1 Tax=Streptomyces sp. NPDC001820 TaxID=3364613 RepID=UPI003694AD3F
MSEEASPRGTFLKIADTVRAQIEADPKMTELPSAAELMRKHGVSRGVALRTFAALQKEGLAEPRPGGRWQVVREGRDRRPLDERIADLISAENLQVGAEFPSASTLSARFGVSRPTVSKALDKLEAAGLLSAGGQGKARRVRALPGGEERSKLENHATD